MLSSASSEAVTRFRYGNKVSTPLRTHKTAIDYMEEIYGTLPQLPVSRRLSPVVRGNVHVANIAEHTGLGLSADEFHQACSFVEYSSVVRANSGAPDSRTASHTRTAAGDTDEGLDEDDTMAAELSSNPIFRPYDHAFYSPSKRHRLDIC